MKITRRKIIIAGGVAGGGLLLGVVGLGGYITAFDQRKMQREAIPDVGHKMVAQWITLSPDGMTTLWSPHTEMGQGAHTGLLQILLDEMDVDPARAQVKQAPATSGFATNDVIAGFALGQDELTGWMKQLAEKTFGRGATLAHVQMTGGSSSIRFTGWRGIRHAGAAAREMLAEAGAAKLGVPVAEVTTADSRVLHQKSGQSVDYGELAAAAAALSVPQDPTFKKPEQWKHIGKRVARVDIPDKVFATAVYGIDVDVPNMRYAAVAPPPMALAKVTGVSNRAEIEKRRGVEAVVVMDDAVAVVADNPWRAEQAARAATLTFEQPEGGPLDSAKILAAQRAAIASGKLDAVHETGDAPDRLSGDGVIEAEYVVPFLAHAAMEPLNATIWTEGGKTHVATGIQAPLSGRAAIAKKLDLPMEDVVLHPHTMGGGFGRRVAMDGAYMNWLTHTALVHKQVGGAVKLAWSREADVKLSTYRPSDVARIRAKLDSSGKPVAWHAQTFAKIGAVREAVPVYDIPNVTIATAAQDPALPFAYWRSVDASTHSFFIESFIDELALAAKQDPVAYRLSLLGHKKRHARVLQRVAAMSGWPGPKGGDRALGVALFESFGSIVAQVAEVSLVDDKPRVHRVWCVIDPGVAINPDSVEAQMEGGIIFGLSAALYGEITLKDGKIQQSNFHDYRMVKFADAPRIKVDILRSLDAPVGGAGEPGTPPIAPAVANALAALGKRVRQLPFDSLVAV